MKLNAIALASLAVVASGTSFAARVVVTDANRINMTGATALRNSIAGTVYNDICAGSTNRTLYNLTRPGGPGNTTSSPTPTANFWSITCTLAAPFNGIAAGTDVAFFKSDAGGSGQGVYPVILNSPRAQVKTDPTSCTNPNVTVSGVSTPNPAVADTQYTGCANDSVLRSPQVGVSDEEPTLFAGINVPTDDTYDETVLQSNDLVSVPVAQTVFAVAVNRNLYEALQTVQGIAGIAGCAVGSTAEACMPSIGKAQAATLFGGFAPDWGVLGVASPSNQINICRRLPGSGTQAAANRFFLEFPCNAAALPPADYTASTVPVSQLAANASATDITNYINANVKNVAGNVFVFEGPGTGNVVSCLNQAQAVGGYAIGHVSKENLIGTDWRHVKLDGIAPNRDNAKAGKYDYLFESTVQYSAATYAALTANQQKFISGLQVELGKPSSLAKLSVSSQEGVAALPNGAIPYGTGNTDERKFYSRVSRNGNSCSPVTAVQ